tara:strand:- start:5816 stop:7162 length:1347 start_codon:yes stop_codon:yes gene_type:complete
MRTLLLLAFALASSVAIGQVTDGQFPVQSNLRAGVAKVDITPRKVAGIETIGHRRVVDGLRDPLRAGVLLLDDGENKAAIVTIDLVNAYDLIVKLIREKVASATGVAGPNIMVTASHNHSGPPCKEDSPYVREVAEKIGKAAGRALSKMRKVNVGYGEDEIRFNINRRKVIDGRAVVWLNPDGPNDPRVKVLRFDDGRSLTPMAVLMHAVCHPCFFTWGDKGTQPYAKGFPKMSADFPGDAQTFVEKNYGNETSALFLQGCAGDIRPNLPGFPYRCADEADMQWAGRGLGSAVIRTLADGVRREKLRTRTTYYPIRVASSVVALPGKEADVQAELMAMKIGPYLLLSMPGEPMVEFGFAIEKAIGPRAIPIIVGYANGALGYIATTESYTVGGYEPKASPLAPEAEPIVIRELGRLADQVIGDVFESFSKHPKDVKKREAEEKARLKK